MRTVYDHLSAARIQEMCGSSSSRNLCPKCGCYDPKTPGETCESCKEYDAIRGITDDDA